MLDEKDLKIISLYSKNPEITQEEMAKTIGISQPSVLLRIKRLKSIGALSKQVGLDPFKLGLHIAKVDVTTSNATRIIKLFKECPYFLNGFITSGRNNLCLFFVAENISTLESIVDTHLRASNDVQNVEFNIVINAINNLVIPLKVYEKALERPPCGTNIECKACPSYEINSCIGCPATKQYKGRLLTSFSTSL
jgi:DNA-binding Lrp family transcriptional regulator